MQEERIYRLIFEHSVQGMVLLQAEKYVLINQSFADMVGYSIDEMMGFSLEDMANLIHPQDREWVMARFNDRVAGLEVPSNYEHRFLRRNGETGWWSAVVSVIEYEGRQAILGTYIDITERKRVEESIRHEREFLVDTLNALPIGVCLNDETGHYQIVNDAYCQIYDFERENIVGKHYTTIMPPDQIELANKHFARILSGDLGIPVERKRQRKDGSIVYIEAANALVEQSDGRKMVITVVRDINERKQMELALRAREEQFRTLVDDAPVAILLVSMTGAVKLANRQAEKLFDCEARVIQDMSLDQLIQPGNHGAQHQPIQHFFRAISQEQPLPVPKEIDTHGLRVTGTPFPADVTLGKIHLQDELMVLAFVIDATERLELEQQQLALHLEQERSAILVSFMQDAAHEFRTPLTTIKSGAYLLNKAQTAEQRDRYDELITSQVDALVRLVSQLTLIARLRYVEEPRKETIELNSLLKHVVLDHQAKCNARQIRIQTESDHEPIYLTGNPDDLKDAFSEIIDNAIRFSADGDQIDLHLGIAENNQAIVTIQDTGAGMTGETQRRAFERFFREDSAHSTRGFGLGLPIAKQIIELHHGSISLESTIAEGTRVRVHLPDISHQLNGFSK